MQSLEINTIVGFIVNYLSPVLLGYLGRLLYSKALIGWPLGNLFWKKEIVFVLRPQLILLDEILLTWQINHTCSDHGHK